MSDFCSFNEWKKAAVTIQIFYWMIGFIRQKSLYVTITPLYDTISNLYDTKNRLYENKILLYDI